jgi:hypothetical protein
MRKIWDLVPMALGLAVLVGLIWGLGAAFQASGRGAATDGQGEPPPATMEPSTDGQGYPPPAPTYDPRLSVPEPTIAPTPTATMPPLADVPESYDPKTYGLPDEIAGYKVLVVVTSENQACMPPGMKSITVQTLDVDGFLQNQQSPDIFEAMEALGLNMTEWGVGIVGPGTNREQIIQGVQEWNKDMHNSGCTTTGGPIILETPLPIP